MYDTLKSDFDKPYFDGKNQSREPRKCPIVSKHQLSIPDVSPGSYVGIDVNTGFK